MQKQVVIGIALFLAIISLRAQGLVVNEVSNGPAGTQEYIELVVVGPNSAPNCGPIDIRGWIIDDNNGDFACGACSGTGIAAGHIRFGNLPVWSAVPTGSIIVVYEPAVKNSTIPADDPDDTAVPDGVYILPSNSALIEATTTPCAGGNVPSSAGSCPASCTGLTTYAGACYTAGFNNASWGLRNSGDAAQVRRPDGTYFHGISYGTAASLINGGPDGLQVSNIDGGGRCYSFANVSNDNFRLVSNYVTGTVAGLNETPGVGNSVTNLAWIATLKLSCPLAVSYYRSLAAQAQGSANLLTWSTASELQADRWEVLRTHDLTQDFETIASVTAVGNSRTIQEYTYLDEKPLTKQSWYQLRAWDRNGVAVMSETVSVINGNVTGVWANAWPNPSQGQLQLQGSLPQLQSLRIADQLGRIILELPLTADEDRFEFEIDLTAIPRGHYLLILQGKQHSLTQRISLQ